MENGFLKINNMDTKRIQEEINRIKNAPFSKKSDKQLIANDNLSALHKLKYSGIQPIEFERYNNHVNRKTKLTAEDVIAIRSKYNPYIVGKKKLAHEYGVSVSLIHKIIHRLKWKNV